MNSFPVHVIGTQRKRTGRNADNIKGMPTRYTFSSRKSHVIAYVSNPSLPLSMVPLRLTVAAVQGVARTRDKVHNIAKAPAIAVREETKSSLYNSRYNYSAGRQRRCTHTTQWRPA